MKSLTNRVVLVVLIALCAVAVQAQSYPMLKGTVPVNFVVADHDMPAGEYIVKSLGNDIEAWYDQNGRGMFLVNTVPMGKEAAPDTTKLVFRRYGDTYFLSEVWSRGTSYQVRSGNREQHIAQSQRPEIVAVLMTR